MAVNARQSAPPPTFLGAGDKTRKKVGSLCSSCSPSFGSEDQAPEFVRGKLLSELSTWGIGGAARLFVEVRNREQLVSSIRHCREHNLKFLALGKGSNCLFDDRGFDGCVILSRINDMHENGCGRYRVGSGYPFNLLGIHTSKQGFGGLEFASGIPGTVGGAVFMNAGADGQETIEVLEAVEFVDTNGQTRELLKKQGELACSYRKSPFQGMPDLGAILFATFQLQPCPLSRDRQRDYLARRKQTQPVNERSAGCVFRNPGKGCQSAGALIEAVGLKGLRIGGAKVSELHANFLINTGGAKASDVLSLISVIKDRVRAESGIQLEQEVRYIPY
ncbi:hypothetical protein SELMODRAFT_81558 [Selaginella moellendorffii]|uniref:UDP-N-acetylmuramate dehydrogenase n=1 Tax=Selaginella moellendorffii TaxID=88036 RepID=D8R0A1_SELML|nr:uncharacterized protein LOC9654070 [Selaginella moellendorffii]EFJ34939.1 hypothetical protein SELMODRAFT_81558 [Selaginella moellendorffii]|eukprot:XP_002964606.1 uncharacterized protein LOC9654070 [Selaginella moellendorffii]